MPLEQTDFEVTEDERSGDAAHLRVIFTEHRRHGMRTAIDDFAAGPSGLNLLAQRKPDIVQIEMALTRSIHADRVRRVITRSIVQMCEQLDITVIAEGIESLEEAPPPVSAQALRAVHEHFEEHLLALPAL